MDNRVSLSVIIPIYNTEKYLDDCLSSIANQSVPFDEVILVNDGSTDGSRALCEKYCHVNRNFILMNQKNMGLSGARNNGFKTAKGDYVIYIDSDDYVQNCMAEIIKQELSRKSCDVLYYNASIKYETNTGESKNYFIRDAKYYGRDMTGVSYLLESFPENYIVSPCMAAFKKAFLSEQQIWFPEGIYFEDNYYCLKVALSARSVRCISNVFYIRRCREGAITTGKMTNKKCSSLIRGCRLMCEELRNSGLDPSFLMSFISSNLLYIFNTVENAEPGDDIRNERNGLIDYFVEYWLQLYLSSERSLGDSATLLLALQELEKRSKRMNKKPEKYIDELRDEIENGITDRLKEIPLGEADKKIGIYGIGSHTLWLLKCYRLYVGEILCDLYFIVTDHAADTAAYQGRRLVSCDDIPEGTDKIVVSSLFYQKDMYQELADRGIPEKTIQLLYGDKDICDLNCIWKVLTSGYKKEQQ
ncbi:MAG: glycosyltransferase family 2 protein [Clostridiales bacterium]|nr:glycosyltransferase family 2 protein [Clostridiales bacterium]